jgi:hypothetical protein
MNHDPPGPCMHLNFRSAAQVFVGLEVLFGMYAVFRFLTA